MTNEEITKYAEEYVATFEDGVPTEASTKYVIDNPVEDKELQEAIMHEVHRITGTKVIEPEAGEASAEEVTEEGSDVTAEK